MNEPRPRMTSARPFDTASSVAKRSKTRTGSSELSTVTAVPSRMRVGAAGDRRQHRPRAPRSRSRRGGARRRRRSRRRPVGEDAFVDDVADHLRLGRGLPSAPSVTSPNVSSPRWRLPAIAASPTSGGCNLVQRLAASHLRTRLFEGAPGLADPLLANGRGMEAVIGDGLAELGLPQRASRRRACRRSALPASSSSSSLLCIRACSFQIRFRFRTPIRRTYSAWQGCCSLARSGDAASTTATGRTPNLHRFATPRQAGAHSVLPSGEPTSSRGTCTAAAFGGRRRPQCAGEGPPPRALTTAPATGMRERLQPFVQVRTNCT